MVLLFKPFADLLCYANDTQKQTIKTAIITDDDRCADKFNIEQYVEKEIDFDTAKIANVVEKNRKRNAFGSIHKTSNNVRGSSHKYFRRTKNAGI